MIEVDGDSQIKTLIALEVVLAAAATNTPAIKGARDELIVSLLGREGLKATELVNLTWDDIGRGVAKPEGDYQWNFIRINRGGTYFYRWLEISVESADLLRAYRDLCPVPLSGDRPVFIGFKGRGGKDRYELGLTRHGLKFMLTELGNKLGIRLNAERLRGEALERMVKAGMTEKAIQQRLGLRRKPNTKHSRVM